MGTALFDVEVIFPLWKLPVQDVYCVCEDRIAKEAQPERKADGLDDPVTGREWDGERDECQSTRQT